LKNITSITKNLYSQLSEEERARLMYKAVLRKDKNELNTLQRSALKKQYKIRAREEVQKCNAWEDIHKTLIIFCLDSRIRQYSCLTVSDQLLHKNDHKEAEKIEQAMLGHLLKYNCYIQAFRDWTTRYDVPINKGLLTAFNIKLEGDDPILIGMKHYQEGLKLLDTHLPEIEIFPK